MWDVWQGKIKNGRSGRVFSWENEWEQRPVRGFGVLCYEEFDFNIGSGFWIRGRQETRQQEEEMRNSQLGHFHKRHSSLLHTFEDSSSMLFGV